MTRVVIAEKSPSGRRLDRQLFERWNSIEQAIRHKKEGKHRQLLLRMYSRQCIKCPAVGLPAELTLVPELALFCFKEPTRYLLASGYLADIGAKHGPTIRVPPEFDGSKQMLVLNPS